MTCTTTIVCDQCHELFDIVIARRKRWGEGELADVAPRCRKFAPHTFREWNDGDHCPRCYGAMENQGGGCMWD